MAFLSAVTNDLVRPQPQAGPTPVAAAIPVSPGTHRLAEDRISAPRAQPSPAAAGGHAAGPYDALPVLAAAALLAGGAALALPAVEGVVAVGEAVSSLASAASRTAAFVRTAARECASEYRTEGAQKVAGFTSRDPVEIGRALGAQGWSATEELGRSAVVGAGLAAGAWAAQGIHAAIEPLIDAGAKAFRKP